MPDGRATVVEVAQDTRIRPPVHLAIGPVLHPDEVAADKTLALFGRAAARDLLDVHALTNRYSIEQMAALDEEKDRGFQASAFADALRAAAALPASEFSELGLDADEANDLRAWARRLADALAPASRASAPRPPSASPFLLRPRPEPRVPPPPPDERPGPSPRP